MENFLEKLSEIEETTHNSLDELINDVFDHLNLSVAIFDEDHIIKGICMHAHRCKCYYLLLHNQPTECSIFNKNFTREIISKDNVDMLCDYGCRLASRKVDIHNKQYTIILYQFNFESDSLEFNPTNNPNYIPLYHGDPTSDAYF